MFEFTERKGPRIWKRLRRAHITLLLEDTAFEKERVYTIYEEGYFQEKAKVLEALRNADQDGRFLPSWEQRGAIINRIGYSLHEQNVTYCHSMSFQEYLKRGKPSTLRCRF